LLDVGAGTGDLAMKAACRDARLFVVAADFTLEMMQAGRLKRAARSVCWVNNDALNLPYPSETFDAVISGYLLRNVNDIRIALVEQLRVLRSGGRIVCLDTTPPPPDIWHLPVRLYLKYMIPLIGGLAAGDMPAYHYLSESTVQFVRAGELGELMRQVGFKEVGYRCFMGGCMAIHWGRK
jgi:demethylmenaquinone methyltransferase/2-methoxy-6-polyprenyl-1,4-benzoquinol methylase